MAEPRTRRPSGRRRLPLVVVEGVDHVDATAVAVRAAGGADSAAVGTVYVLDHGDTDLDALAGAGPFEVLEWNGTWGDAFAQAAAAAALPSSEDAPNVVVVPASLWHLLVSTGADRHRRSRSVEQLLADDPHAEVPVPASTWDQIDREWASLLRSLRRRPIVPVFALQSISGPDGVEPTVNTSRTGLVRQAEVWVTVDDDQEAPSTVVAARPLTFAGLRVPTSDPVGWTLRLLADEFPVAHRPPTVAQVGVTRTRGVDQVRDAARRHLGRGASAAAVNDHARRALAAAGLSDRKEFSRADLAVAVGLAGSDLSAPPPPAGGDGDQQHSSPACAGPDGGTDNDPENSTDGAGTGESAPPEVSPTGSAAGQGTAPAGGDEDPAPSSSSAGATDRPGSDGHVPPPSEPGEPDDGEAA